MHKFWLISGFQNADEVDPRYIRQNVPDVNYSNFVTIKENCSILCLRFSQQVSEDMISEWLPMLNLKEESSRYTLHSCQTVHTTPEQKNIFVCHIPPFLQDENNFSRLINSFTKKVQIINNSEYMTIRCQSSQNSSFVATYLRAIPEECLSCDIDSKEKDDETFAKNRNVQGQKLTVELSIEQLPIVLIFKVGRDITNYETGIPVLATLRKEGLRFTVTKSHIASPTMQVIAVTAESFNDVYTIIDRVTQAGFNAKRFLSVPYQEELEKNEVIIEDLSPELTLADVVQRLQIDFNAKIYEARLISTPFIDPSTQTQKERRDALIIFYDYEDAQLVTKPKSEGLFGRMYRTTALLFNLPPDSTIDEIRNYVSELKYLDQDGKIRQPLKPIKDRIDIAIHQIRTFTSNSFETTPEGSYAEVKFPDLDFLKEFLKFYNSSRFVLPNLMDRQYRLRDIYIPFATEAKRGRYKREVHFEKTVNNIARNHKSIMVRGCSISKAISIITKLSIPLLYYGTLENDKNKRGFSSNVITVANSSKTARSKALQILMMTSNTKANSSQENHTSSRGNEEDDYEPEEINDHSFATILTFCGNDDMEKATSFFKSVQFEVSKFDSSIVANDEQLGNLAGENKSLLFNPFYNDRDDTMHFINEPAPQLQIQVQSRSPTKRTTTQIQMNHRNKNQNRHWSANNKNQNALKGDFKFDLPLSS